MPSRWEKKLANSPYATASVRPTATKKSEIISGGDKNCNSYTSPNTHQKTRNMTAPAPYSIMKTSIRGKDRLKSDSIIFEALIQPFEFDDFAKRRDSMDENSARDDKDCSDENKSCEKSCDSGTDDSTQRSLLETDSDFEDIDEGDDTTLDSVFASSFDDDTVLSTFNFSND